MTPSRTLLAAANVVTQTLRDGPAAEQFCAPGASFTALAPSEQCNTGGTSGCAYELSASPTQSALALTLAAALLLWLARRRRRLG